MKSETLLQKKKIKRAIGDDTYKKLIKGGDRAKTILQKRKTLMN